MLKQLSYVALLLVPISSFANNNFYTSVFGGAGYSDYGRVSQQGIALFTPERGGWLPVNASGNSNNQYVRFIGLNAGYVWNGWSIGSGCSPWCLAPAAELEAYYLHSRLSAQVSDPNNRLQGHVFDDSFKMNTGVFLVNSVWIFSSPCFFAKPYAGIGAGAARIHVYSGDSTQITPPEPGINHFNSSTNAYKWNFAAQAKAGLRFDISQNWKLFAEYRFLYISPTSYQFGSTQYPTHAATTPWNVHFNRTIYNLGSVGVEYSFGC